MLVSTGTLVLAGGNNITLSQTTGANGATVSINAGNAGVSFSAGGNSAALAAVTFSNSNGVSFGLNGSTITASHNGITSQTNQTLGMYGVGNTTQNSTTTLDARSVSLNGLGAMSVGYSGGSVQLSAPAVSSLSATGAISISTNGSTISIGAPVAPTYTTLSRWEYPEYAFTALGTIPQGSLSIQHMYVPFYVTGSAAKVGGSISVGTSTANATGSAKMSLWMGLYTLNGSTLSLASSGSANNAFSWQAASSVSSTSLTSVSGMRQLTVPMNVNMTPGEYWIAAVMSSATTAPGATMTLYGNNLFTPTSGAAVLTPIGSGTTAARDVVLFEGVYTAATSAGPATISGAQINNTAASVLQSANFYNAIFNATY